MIERMENSLNHRWHVTEGYGIVLIPYGDGTFALKEILYKYTVRKWK